MGPIPSQLWLYDLRKALDLLSCDAGGQIAPSRRVVPLCRRQGGTQAPAAGSNPRQPALLCNTSSCRALYLKVIHELVLCVFLCAFGTDTPPNLKRN
jgi:hypothetical protein